MLAKQRLSVFPAFRGYAWITIENIKGNYIKANEHLIFKVADKAVTELQYLFRNMTRLTENCNETVH